MVRRASRGSKPDLSHRGGGDRGWRGEKSWRWGLSHAATSPLGGRSGRLWPAAPSRIPWPQWSGLWLPAHSSAWTGIPCHPPCPLTQRDPAEHGQNQSRMPAGAGEGAAVGKLGGCITPSDIAERSGASSLGSGHCSWAAGSPPGQVQTRLSAPGAGRTAQEGCALGGSG